VIRGFHGSMIQFFFPMDLCGSNWLLFSTSLRRRHFLASLATLNCKVEHVIISCGHNVNTRLIVQGPLGEWGWAPPPLFWLLNHYFFKFSKLGLSFTKKDIIVCEIYGPLGKRNLFMICPFRSNLVFRGFSRQYRHDQMRQLVVRFVPEQTIRFSPAHSCFYFHSFLDRCFSTPLV